MELSKGKYSKKEVLILINAYRGEYEKRIKAQEEVIKKLNQEIRAFNALNENLSQKEKLVLSMLLRAEKTAFDLEEKSKREYLAAVEKLNEFVKKWDDYFQMLEEKYPLYPPVQKALRLKELVVGEYEKEVKEVIEELESIIDGGKSKRFNPQEKINDYIAATGDNGFNLDEVLNPGELQLEELCKELGLIDSKD